MTPPLDAWGLTGTPVPLAGGHRNTVLRAGDHVLKTTRRSEAAVAWLLPVMDLADRCGLSAARPMRSTRGPYVVDGWTCETFRPGDPTPPRTIKGRMTRLHALARDVPQRPGFASARDLLKASAGGDVDLRHMPPGLVAALRAAWSCLPRRETVIHADLTASNILTDAADTVWLIDWDEARRDTALFDSVAWDRSVAAHARAADAWEIACCWRIEPGRARALAQAFLRA